MVLITPNVKKRDCTTKLYHIINIVLNNSDRYKLV